MARVVSIKIGDKEYKLKWTLKNMMRFEDECERRGLKPDLFDLNPDGEIAFSARKTAILIWACQDQAETVEEIAENVSIDEFENITRAISELTVPLGDGETG